MHAHLQNSIAIQPANSSSARETVLVQFAAWQCISGCGISEGECSSVIMTRAFGQEHFTVYVGSMCR